MSDEDDIEGQQRQAVEMVVTSVPDAAALITRVLDVVHSNLSDLLTKDDLQLQFLHVARQHLAGRDEAKELQVQPLKVACMSV